MLAQPLVIPLVNYKFSYCQPFTHFNASKKVSVLPVLILVSLTLLLTDYQKGNS